MIDDRIAQIAHYADRVLDLKPGEALEEQAYQSLPLCVIDAVYSIGVHFVSVRKVVDRYCAYYSLTRHRPSRKELPVAQDQESISELCAKFERLGAETFAYRVFCNRQRTSTNNGILKAEAVYRFAAALKKHGIEYLQDIDSLSSNKAFEADIKMIPGQKSGVSLAAFFMLAGSDDLIKPDRMILRFINTVLHKTPTLGEAQTLIAGATEVLKARYPHLTPRLLDYEIWNYQRQQATTEQAGKV